MEMNSSDADRWIAEAEWAALDAELRLRCAPLQPQFRIDFDDAAYGPAFRRYPLLSRWPELLNGRAPLTEAARFYNTYYWFLTTIRLWNAKHGYDAGMEQQAFQMLEHADASVDLAVVEAIERQVNAETSEGQ